ncbi:hypothetical protein KCU59_g68, partial [Aureobasidium melanogenum]
MSNTDLLTQQRIAQYAHGYLKWTQQEGCVHRNKVRDLHRIVATSELGRGLCNALELDLTSNPLSSVVAYHY